MTLVSIAIFAGLLVCQVLGQSTDPCTPNPCVNSAGVATQCVLTARACFTTPCPQYTCVTPNTDAACTDTTDCGDGQFCNRRGVCADYAQAGDSCGGFTYAPKECAPGLTCQHSLSQIADLPGVCVDDTQGGIFCADDVRACPDGSSVTRDPTVGCAFPACPSVCSPNPCLANGPSTSVIGQPDASWPFTSAQTVCLPEPKECFTTPCYQFTCEDPSTLITGNDDTLNCADDVLTCADGSTVARDPNNNCAFAPCSDPEEADVCDPNPCLANGQGWIPPPISLPPIAHPPVGVPPSTVNNNNNNMNVMSNNNNNDPATGVSISGGASGSAGMSGTVNGAPNQPYPPTGVREPNWPFTSAQTVCLLQPKECFTTPCYQFTCVEPAQQMCHPDTMTCPDGSILSRDPMQNCEFPQCPSSGIACTLELHICKDGSGVGRTGPNCEFEPCPCATDAGCDANEFCAQGECHAFLQEGDICMMAPTANTLHPINNNNNGNTMISYPPVLPIGRCQPGTTCQAQASGATTSSGVVNNNVIPLPWLCTEDAMQSQGQSLEGDMVAPKRQTSYLALLALLAIPVFLLGLVVGLCMRGRSQPVKPALIVHTAEGQISGTPAETAGETEGETNETVTGGEPSQLYTPSHSRVQTEGVMSPLASSEFTLLNTASDSADQLV